MNWIIAKMKWIMLVSGVVTCSLFYAVLAPQAALRSIFGETLEGPLSEVIVRNWGALITLVGILQIYGAFHAKDRPLILSISVASKLLFVGFILAQGNRYLKPTGPAMAFDLVMVGLFIVYLVGIRRGSTAA